MSRAGARTGAGGRFGRFGYSIIPLYNGGKGPGRAELPAGSAKELQMKRILSVLLVLMLAAAAGAWAQGKIPGNVVSLFQKRCAACHKGKSPPRG